MRGFIEINDYENYKIQKNNLEPYYAELENIKHTFLLGPGAFASTLSMLQYYTMILPSSGTTASAVWCVIPTVLAKCKVTLLE